MPDSDGFDSPVVPSIKVSKSRGGVYDRNPVQVAIVSVVMSRASISSAQCYYSVKVIT